MTVTQPVGSGRPLGSNPQPPNQEYCVLPTELLHPPKEKEEDKEEEDEEEDEEGDKEKKRLK